MGQTTPGTGGRPRDQGRPVGTDSRAQRYRTFSNVNQAFHVNQSVESGLLDVNRESDVTEIQVAVKAGTNEVPVRLGRVPSGRIIMLDSCGFQYDIYLRADRWSFYALRDGIMLVRFI